MTSKFFNKSFTTLLCMLITITGIMALSCFYVQPKGYAEQLTYNESNTKSQRDHFDTGTLRTLFSQTMTGYYELQKSQNPDVEAYDVFIVDKTEADEEELRKLLNGYYSTTPFSPVVSGSTQQMTAQYIIQDTSTKKTISNDTSNVLLNALENPEALSFYPWYVMFSYDSNGVMKLSSSKLLGDSISFASNSSNTLNQNITDFYNSTLQNSDGYSRRSTLGETSTNLIKNATFIFTIDQQSIDLQNNYISDIYYSRDFYTGYATPICCLLLLALGIFIFLRKIKLEDMPFYSIIRKIPYEVHLIIILFALTLTFESYGILFNLTAQFFSFETLISLIQIGIFYLYFAYLFLLLKDSFEKKVWAQHSLTIRVLKYTTKIDLSKKDNIRAFLLASLNFLCLIYFVTARQGLMTFVIAVLYSAAIFFVAVHFLTKTRKDYQTLLDVTKDLSGGDFNSEIHEDLGVFNDFKNDIVEIRANFKQAVEEEVHSQKMKTELISNVSHDLKTPLTSIITYTDLLKNEDITEKERKKYIATLDRNALRLKHLIEDLFEVSKANSGNIKLEKIELDICSLMIQVQVELADKIKKSKLDIRNDFSNEKILCFMDPQKMYRVLENLLINITKYAMPSTRVYIDIVDKDTAVEISLRNISATELNFKAEDISERFMRGDKSRNTEGSGLGLAIAKTFSELHNGKLDVYIDGDLFKVILYFPKNLTTTSDCITPQE